jgi:peroxiredoxin
MSLKENSSGVNVGEDAPHFELENYEDQKVALDDLDNYDGVLVVFMCNHCPFVQGQAEELRRLEEEYSSIAIV